MRKHTRITRVKRSNVLADIYGSLYNDYQMTRSTKPNVRKQAIKLINQLSSSEIQLHHESELNKIRELHTLLYKILNAIKTDTDGSIMTIDIDKFKRINRVIKGYNEYVKDNDIFRLKYNYSLIPIILPSNICFHINGKPVKVKRVIKQLTNVGIGKGGCYTIHKNVFINKGSCHTVHRDAFNGKRLIIIP